jgi:hypothetical protein
MKEISRARSSGGGFNLRWLLYAAAIIDGYLGPLCTWVPDCFNTIVCAMGIEQALVLVSLIPCEPGMLRWMDDIEYKEDFTDLMALAEP